MTNLNLLRSTSCRVVASVLDAAEDLEDVEVTGTAVVPATLGLYPIVSLRALCRLIQSTTGPITTKIYPDMANFIIDCPSAVK